MTDEEHEKIDRHTELGYRKRRGETLTPEEEQELEALNAWIETSPLFQRDPASRLPQDILDLIKKVLNRD